MSQSNPLQKFFRQPKVFIALPSKGLFYEPGALVGDYTNVPVFAMTGMDEIIMKTPDALFTGEATARVIESCCPYIKNAKTMPGIDIDALLIAIRIATFGGKMNVTHTCPACSTENDYEIELSTLLDYFNGINFISNIKVSDEISIKIRPLQYEEMNYFSIENFKLQKTLMQTREMTEEDRQKQIDDIYKQLSELQLQLYLTAIETVQAETISVTEKAHIEEWLRNTERETYQAIKEKLEANKSAWSIPTQTVQCANCGVENQITVNVDQSSFFG